MYRIRQTVYWEHSSHCISTNHRISDTDDKGLLKWSIHTKTSVPGKAINIGSGLKWEEQDLTAAASHTHFSFSLTASHTSAQRLSGPRPRPRDLIVQGERGPRPWASGAPPTAWTDDFHWEQFSFQPRNSF